ncbi:MAG: hypothetical protein HZB31_12180 [Nitrospirae bacterium]|nr:hypothetical protein [Nitrospirota bacterium]
MRRRNIKVIKRIHLRAASILLLLVTLASAASTADNLPRSGTVKGIIERTESDNEGLFSIWIIVDGRMHEFLSREARVTDCSAEDISKGQHVRVSFKDREHSEMDDFFTAKALTIKVIRPGTTAAPNGEAVVEYRLESMHGQEPSKTFQWRDGSRSVKTETQPFMAISDFRVARTVPTGRNSPGNYSVELIHTKSGAKKFREVADRDRQRQFSILVDSRIVQSYAFPPAQKKVYDRGTTLYGPFTKTEAASLARRINASIRAQSRSLVK